MELNKSMQSQDSGKKYRLGSKEQQLSRSLEKLKFDLSNTKSKQQLLNSSQLNIQTIKDQLNESQNNSFRKQEPDLPSKFSKLLNYFPEKKLNLGDQHASEYNSKVQAIKAKIQQIKINRIKSSDQKKNKSPDTSE